MKKSGCIRVPSMSCKAWNGRVVLEYLASTSRLATMQQAATGPQRCFGKWLDGQVQQGLATFPLDPKIAHQALALIPRPLMNTSLFRCFKISVVGNVFLYV